MRVNPAIDRTLEVLSAARIPSNHNRVGRDGRLEVEGMADEPAEPDALLVDGVLNRQARFRHDRPRAEAPPRPAARLDRGRCPEREVPAEERDVAVRREPREQL